MTHIFGLVLYFLLSRLFVLLLMIEGSLVRTIRHTFIIDVGCETPGWGWRGGVGLIAAYVDVPTG